MYCLSSHWAGVAGTSERGAGLPGLYHLFLPHGRRQVLVACVHFRGEPCAVGLLHVTSCAPTSSRSTATDRKPSRQTVPNGSRPSKWCPCGTTRSGGKPRRGRRWPRRKRKSSGRKPASRASARGGWGRACSFPRPTTTSLPPAAALAQRRYAAHES